MASVEYRNVSKKYDDVQVLNDISLHINDGEFVVLVGPSGCGKSTTLRMLAGLETVTEGQIFIDDTDVTNYHPKDRDIAMVFQNYALYPHMSVRENLAFGLKMRGMDRSTIDERVEEAARILKIEMLLDRKPKALSGGQRQRVALGRAIVRKPKVFLFDEPLSNLDAKLRVQMRAEIKRLHQELGVTMVYVTHDQIEAMTMGHRICLMDAGIIQQYDTPLNIYNHPENQFVAGFIGSPPMNFIHSKVSNGSCSIGGFEIPVKGIEHGKEVILGIRPEDIVIADSGIAAQVEILEPLGNEINVHLNIDKTTVTARLTPDVALHPGQHVFVKLTENKIHWFDSTTLIRHSVQ